MTNLFSLEKFSCSAEIVNNQDLGDLVAGTTDYKGKLVNDSVHYHDNPTICFMLHGGGVEHKSCQTYERPACDARFYYAAQTHQSIIKTFPSRCFNLELKPAFLKRYEISENIINKAVNDNLNAKLLMLKAHSEFLTNDSFTESSIKILLLGMLNETESLASRKRPKWIDKLHQILNDCWAENLTLEDLSVAVSVHPVTISKQFTKYFACTLGEYLRKLRINKSIPLIRNSEFSLTEIALLCGFADQSHFTRNFKKMTGFLPKDFKRL